MKKNKMGYRKMDGEFYLRYNSRKNALHEVDTWAEMGMPRGLNRKDIWGWWYQAKNTGNPTPLSNGVHSFDKVEKTEWKEECWDIFRIQITQAFSDLGKYFNFILLRWEVIGEN